MCRGIDPTTRDIDPIVRGMCISVIYQYTDKKHGVVYHYCTLLPDHMHSLHHTKGGGAEALPATPTHGSLTSHCTWFAHNTARCLVYEKCFFCTLLSFLTKRTLHQKRGVSYHVLVSVRS